MPLKVNLSAEKSLQEPVCGIEYEEKEVYVPAD